MAANPYEEVVQRQALRPGSEHGVIALMSEETKAAFAARWDGSMATAHRLAEQSGLPLYRVLATARDLGLKNPKDTGLRTGDILEVVADALRDDEETHRMIRARIGEERELPSTGVADEGQNMTKTIPSPDGKVCDLCGEHKPFSAFRRAPRSADGYAHHCMDCYAGAAHELEAKAKHAPVSPPPPPAPRPLAVIHTEMASAPARTTESAIGVAADAAPLAALLEQLPRERVWTNDERVRWLKAFAAVIDWLIRVEAA